MSKLQSEFLINVAYRICFAKMKNEHIIYISIVQSIDQCKTAVFFLPSTIMRARLPCLGSARILSLIWSFQLRGLQNDSLTASH